MKKTLPVVALCLVMSSVCVLNAAHAADVLQMPGDLKSLEFVTVGDSKNEPDPATNKKLGTVDYVYGIGKYDVTAAQYCEFLNAVASESDPHELYNPAMETSPRGCRIHREKAEKGWKYSVAAEFADRPVNFISWGDAARFCNWLQNGQKDDPATLEDGAYALDGKIDLDGLMAVKRKEGAKFFLPTVHEWYKAAYYSPNKGGESKYWKYPMQSDDMPSNQLSAEGKNNANFEKNGFTVAPKGETTPVGSFAASPSPWGTFDQGGNVWQWLETAPSEWTRGMRGGAFVIPYTYLESKSKGEHSPTFEEYHLGFRVAKAVDAKK